MKFEDGSKKKTHHIRVVFATFQSLKRLYLLNKHPYSALFVKQKGLGTNLYSADLFPAPILSLKVVYVTLFAEPGLIHNRVIEPVYFTKIPHVYLRR